MHHLHRAHLFASDLDKTLAFYGEVFDAEMRGLVYPGLTSRRFASRRQPQATRSGPFGAFRAGASGTGDLADP